MSYRPLTRLGVIAASALQTALMGVALAQTPAAGPDAAATTGTVFDVKGDVMIMHGARTASAARGVTVQPGDRVFVQPDAVLLIRCPESDVMRITAAGSFTFSGCQRAAVAAKPAAPVAAPLATTPIPPAATSSAPIVVARSGGGMGGGTLGVIGGLVLLGAAAGGGGGGGGGGSSGSGSSSSASSSSSSSSSSSPPISP